MNTTDIVLVKINRAALMLRDARTIQDAKRIIDLAEAARVYARRVGAAREAVDYATEVRLRAERLLGGFLEKDAQKHGGDRKSRLPPGTLIPKQLKELGLSQHSSARARAFAKISEEKFERAVRRAKQQGDLTIKRAVRELKATQRNRALPGEKYQLIYADPPWQFGLSEPVERRVEVQYATMPLEQVKSLGVAALAAADAILFLWVPSSLILDGLAVLEAWGFRYKTTAVWVKDKFGMGYYFRQQHELLLIGEHGRPDEEDHEFLFVGTRGQALTADPARRSSSVIFAPRRKHSQKPRIVYEILEKMYPRFKKIELFAREKRPGWKSWGNEVTSERS